jgi:uncharacterized protein (TIGR02646 family)
MRKFARKKSPEVLMEIVGNSEIPRWQVYGEQYSQSRYTTNHSFKFQWPQIDGKKLNQYLLPDLMAMTDEHCAYCDKFPLLKGDDSIDHFCPKSLPDFYSLVCNWENLYIACKHCQDSKGSQFENTLLRPDEIDYDFRRYFIYDYIKHKVELNPLASDDEKVRAEVTIRIFELNHPSMCTSRRHAYERFTKDNAPILSDYNFRFMFDE